MAALIPNPQQLPTVPDQRSFELLKQRVERLALQIANPLYMQRSVRQFFPGAPPNLGVALALTGPTGIGAAVPDSGGALLLGSAICTRLEVDDIGVATIEDTITVLNAMLVEVGPETVILVSKLWEPVGANRPERWLCIAESCEGEINLAFIDAGDDSGDAAVLADDTWQKVPFSLTARSAEEFSIIGGDTIRYDGTAQRTATVDWSGTLFSDSNNRTYELRISKNNGAETSTPVTVFYQNAPVGYSIESPRFTINSGDTLHLEVRTLAQTTLVSLTAQVAISALL